METSKTAVLILHTAQGSKIATYTAEISMAFDLLNRLKKTHAELKAPESISLNLSQNERLLYSLQIPREKLGFLMHVCSQRFGERSDALHRLKIIEI